MRFSTEQYGWALLCCVTAFFLGTSAAQAMLSVRLARTRGFTLAPDTRPEVCTVTLEGIRDGKAVGTLVGSGRVFIGDVQAFPDVNGLFAVPAGPFLSHRVTVAVPPGAAFVASRRGSRYYPVLSSAGQAIAPQNRTYFGSAAEAAAAGYRP